MGKKNLWISLPKRNKNHDDINDMITGKIIAKDLLLLVSCTYYPTDKNINREKGQKRKPN